MPLWKKKQKVSTTDPNTKGGAAPSEKTLIGPGWCLKGRIYGKGQVVVQSTFEGEMDLQGGVTVDTSATVKGMFRAEEFHIRGQLEGAMEGSRMIALESSARVDGEVTTPRLQMDAGAHLSGNVSMKKN